MTEILNDESPMRSFTLRDVPWSQLGATLPEGQVVNADQAAELGGLNFDVELRPAGFRTGRSWRSVGNRRACVRKDNDQFFNFVSADYHPIQYGEAFTFLDEINPRYVAAGTLGGGRVGFMVVQLPNHLETYPILGSLGDHHEIYVVVRTSHDLTKALECAVMMLRDRCMNALTLSSFTRDAPQRWSVKHVGQDPVAKLAQARTVLARTGNYVRAFDRVATDLNSMRLTTDDGRELLYRLLPDKPRRTGTVTTILDAWDSPTNGFPGTGWGLINAVSEYFEWGRSEGLRTPASHFTSGLSGDTRRYVNRTAQLLRTR